MIEPEGGVIVGILGQWASGKTEAARTLIRHLGGEGKVVFLTDRVLFASQAVKHILELDDSEVTVSIEDGGGQRFDSKLITIWLDPGEDLRSVDPGSLNFDVYDDEVMLAWRKQAKVELGNRIRKTSTGRKPVVVEAAFGPNPEQEGQNPYGRTISDLLTRLENSGVEPGQVKWIIVEAGYATRSERNEKRQANIPAQYFKRFGADGGDLDQDYQKRLEERGMIIQRVPNDHDDVERFRADIIAAFEGMFRDVFPPSTVEGK